MAGYESKSQNYEEIPVTSRRSTQENHLLEFLKLREEIESHYKEIREKKRKLQDLLEKDSSLKEIDTKLRKIPREAEERRKKRKITYQSDEEKTEDEEKKRKQKIRNAIKNKKQQWRSYIQQGYTMTEGEIAEEGGEKFVSQFLFYKDLEDGKKSQHIMKGIRGLKLSSNLGDPEQEEMEE